MKKHLTLLLLLLPLFTFSQITKKVLLIGIDGCRPDALSIANTPNLDGLISNGIYSPHALNDDITISGPGWSAILCGTHSDKHLVTDNDFTGNDYATYPSLIKRAEEFDPTLHTVSICHWAPINDFIMADAPDFKLNTSSDLEVATQASSYLELNDPDLMFLHFDDADHVGHSDGFSPTVPTYISAIEGFDTHVGTILTALEQRPNYANEDWLILVTTDHGGLGTSHGGNSIEERNVFVIASGNTIPAELVQRDSTITNDDPDNCLGETIELRFDGDNDQVVIPPNSLFDFGTDQDFTIECRVRTTNAADVAILGNKDWDSGVNRGFVFSFRFPSGPEWKVNIGDGVNRADINTGGSIADNEWHTLSASFDRDGMMRMYEDGSLIDMADISNVGDISTNQGLFFGTDFNDAYDFNGALAEVRVWNTIVDGQTIADWSCDTLATTHPNYSELLGYWKLNETTGNVVIDHSVNNNNGTINDAAWLPLGTIVTYDYSNTPRLVDVPVTALTHLCIPIQEAWDLDGKSLIPECMSTGSKEIIEDGSFHLFPNPAKNYIALKSDYWNDNQIVQLECYHATGQKVLEQQLSINELSIDTSKLIPGSYYSLITIDGKQYLNRFMVY